MSIYIIRSKDLSLHDCYIGSTKNIATRKYIHKSICYNDNVKEYNIKLYQFIRENGGWDNFEMVEICKCDTDKLKEMEQYHIDFIKPSLNCNRSYGIKDRTEYYIEYEKEKRNSVKRAERSKIKFTCECGSTFRQYEKARHNRTIKHQNYIQSLSSS